MKNEAIKTLSDNELSQDANVNIDLLMEETQLHLNKLRTAISKATLCAAIVGYELKWFMENKRYRILGFETLEDFALDQFKFSRATAYNYIKLYEHCAQYTIKDDKPLIEMKEEYKEYGCSQLFEIAKLKENDSDLLKLINPTMSVREIKKIIKEAQCSTSKDGDKDTSTPQVNNDVVVDADVIDMPYRNIISVEGTTWEDIISSKTQQSVYEVLEAEKSVDDLVIEIVISRKTVV